jgi:hypothetical protein
MKCEKCAYLGDIHEFTFCDEPNPQGNSKLHLECPKCESRLISDEKLGIKNGAW